MNRYELDRELSDMDTEDIIAASDMFDRLVNEQKNEITEYCNAIGCMEHVPKNADETSAYCKDHQTLVLTVWDYECAINSQSACNATGLINSMSELREKLWNNARQLGHGTEYVNHHPILQLYAYQLAHLCHGREPIEWEGFSIAYQFCKDVVAGNCLPNFDYTLGNPDLESEAMKHYRML